MNDYIVLFKRKNIMGYFSIAIYSSDILGVNILSNLIYLHRKISLRLRFDILKCAVKSMCDINFVFFQFMLALVACVALVARVPKLFTLGD